MARSSAAAASQLLRLAVQQAGAQLTGTAQQGCSRIVSAGAASPAQQAAAAALARMFGTGCAASPSIATAASHRVGMIMEAGMWRGAKQLSAAGSAGGRAGSLLVRMLQLRLKSTAVMGAEAVARTPAAATAAAAAVAPSLALSAGLGTGARRALAVWLGGLSVWVYSMVVLGGITRLTRSGLSMTEWKLAGERPPVSQSDWEAEFAKYRASPEYQKLHRGMDLAEFKFIYWMEYAHRMWGRLLGVAFALPAAAFAVRRCVSPALARRLVLLFFMGGTQGLVGWWMVRSGLQEPEHEWSTPRVSPYRLAAHLVSAFAIYATLAWTTLDVMYPRPATAGASDAVVRATAVCRRRVLPLAALIALTATSGAFVAGMDAGRAYNTWPLMGDVWVPEEYWSEKLGPLRNFFENTAAVQFDHRVLATASLAGVGAAWLTMRNAPIPQRAKTCLHAVAAVTGIQFLLGVYTLLEYVPVHLGSLHQANALNLFTAVLALLHALRPPALSAMAAAAAPWITPVAAALVASIGYTVVQQNGALTESPEYRGPSPAAAGGKRP